MLSVDVVGWPCGSRLERDLDHAKAMTGVATILEMRVRMGPILTTSPSAKLMSLMVTTFLLNEPYCLILMRLIIHGSRRLASVEALTDGLP
jgi:hypothetical protein